MSQRYLGGVITANPTAPTMTTESGVWTLEQQFQYSNVWSPKIVGNSVRLRASASAYFNRTPASASNRTTWTWSGWVKRGTVDSGTYKQLWQAGSGTARDSFFFDVDAPDTLMWYGGASYGAAYGVRSLAVFRDPSAWYHIIWSADTTQATASNRLKLYVNGVQQTLTTAVGSGFLPQNTLMYVNTAAIHAIGANAGASEYLDGYMAEVNFIDGQALTPSSFGAYDTNGIWQPLPYTGTYGTNGFYLTFADNSGATATTIGKDYSGNGNNWTPNNISLTAGATYDWMLDTPTNSDNGGNGRGNYAVVNPLATNNPVQPTVTVSNGNLTFSGSAASNNQMAFGSISISSGKWYFEAMASTLGGNYPQVGFIASTFAINSTVNSFVGAPSNGYGYASSGQSVNNGSLASYGASYTTTDVVGVAFDADAGTITFYKNGTSQGTAFSSIPAGTYSPAVSAYNGGAWQVNFGQRPFAYTPPTGFKALNTQNMPTPTITKGNKAMGITLYTGNGSTQLVNTSFYTSNSGGQPDFIWLKSRSAATNHGLFDSNRGWAKALYSNSTSAEVATAGVGGVDSANFSLGGDGAFNTNAATYVAWQWQAGGTAVSNTNGSITSSVSANTTAGFSVVTYTGNGTGGATVGHGLGATPKMAFFKSRSAVNNWIVYSASLGNTGGLYLNGTNAFSSSVAFWNNTSPTSSVITLGNGEHNTNAATYVAYCFAEVSGYSKFGSYTGNGSTDGPFVYCGFRPRFVMYKRTDSAGYGWAVWDTSRDLYNAVTLYLQPNTSGAEGTFGAALDIVSNGFKMRTADAGNNASGGTYIYAAFAENPFNISRAR